MDERVLDVKLGNAFYPHVTVDAAIAQKINRRSVGGRVGALGGIDDDSELVFAVGQQVGNVLAEPGKTALVGKRRLFVDEHGGAAHHPVKMQDNAFAFHLVWNDKELAVLHNLAFVFAGKIAVFRCAAVVRNIDRANGRVKIFVLALFRGIIGSIPPPVI